MEGQPHAGESIGSTKTKRVTGHHPARAVALIGDKLVVRIHRHFAESPAGATSLGKL